MAGSKQTIDMLRGDKSANVADARPLFVVKRRRNWIFWLKVALPIMAIVVISYLVVSSILGRGNIVQLTQIAEVPMIKAGVTVNNVKYDGSDSKGQPFSITATSASQPQGDDDVINLTQPQADITMADGAWIALTATNGVYRRKEDVLDLTGNVTMFHDNGMSFQTNAATIDLKAHTAKGNQPVEGQRSDGQIASDGFEVRDDGKTIIFTGRALLTIFAKNGKDKNG
jgi:lipopolysaccharide export system protein LptC